MRRAIVLAAMLTGGCDTEPKKVAPMTRAEQAADNARQAEQRMASGVAAQKAKDEAQASKERRFKSDAETHAEMHVHDALIQLRGDSLPEHWREKGEMIKREDDFAMVLIRTGIKEGMLSDLVVVQSYLVSVRMNMPGDKVYLSAAQRCSDPPSAAVVAMMMIKNDWPSAGKALAGPKKKTRRNADEGDE